MIFLFKLKINVYPPSEVKSVLNIRVSSQHLSRRSHVVLKLVNIEVRTAYYETEYYVYGMVYEYY